VQRFRFCGKRVSPKQNEKENKGFHLHENPSDDPDQNFSRGPVSVLNHETEGLDLRLRHSGPVAK
jgi:hypothetical protein